MYILDVLCACVVCSCCCFCFWCAKGIWHKRSPYLAWSDIPEPYFKRARETQTHWLKATARSNSDRSLDALLQLPTSIPPNKGPFGILGGGGRAASSLLHHYNYKRGALTARTSWRGMESRSPERCTLTWIEALVTEVERACMMEHSFNSLLVPCTQLWSNQDFCTRDCNYMAWAVYFKFVVLRPLGTLVMHPHCLLHR